MPVGGRDCAENDALVGKVESETTPPEQIPTDDTIYRSTAGGQVTLILDSDLYIGRVLRPVDQLGQDAPLDLQSLVEADRLALASRQIETLGEFAVDGAGGCAGIEQEVQGMAIADAALDHNDVAIQQIHGQLVGVELASGLRGCVRGFQQREGQQDERGHDDRRNSPRAHAREGGSGTSTSPWLVSDGDLEHV